MGDTVAKHFECCFSSRGDQLDHSSALGREISNLCYGPLLDCGQQALDDCKKDSDTPALREAVAGLYRDRHGVEVDPRRVLITSATTAP